MSSCQERSWHWPGRMGSAQRQVIITRLCGPRWGSCTRLGWETVGRETDDDEWWHDDPRDEDFVPRLVEALAGKQVVGASAGSYHTVVRTRPGHYIVARENQRTTVPHLAVLFPSPGRARRGTPGTSTGAWLRGATARCQGSSAQAPYCKLRICD